MEALVMAPTLKRYRDWRRRHYPAYEQTRYVAGVRSLEGVPKGTAVIMLEDAHRHEAFADAVCLIRAGLLTLARQPIGEKQC